MVCGSIQNGSHAGGEKWLGDILHKYSGLKYFIIYHNSVSWSKVSLNSLMWLHLLEGCLGQRSWMGFLTCQGCFIFFHAASASSTKPASLCCGFGAIFLEKDCGGYKLPTLKSHNIIFTTSYFSKQGSKGHPGVTGGDIDTISWWEEQQSHCKGTCIAG